ncbi:MAG: FAD-dependent oxidoreductase, partial [Proteobacteria bacterium]|nr:FAD-dependent oxidoreductase [Pseudomonadota bacterium]
MRVKTDTKSIMKNSNYDVVIVGAGPAGLFAAYELSKTGKKILIIDKGRNIEERKCPILEGKVKECIDCQPCGIMSGIGGAGLFSDGKLNFIPKLGKTDLTEFMNYDEAKELINYTETVFNDFGMDGKTYPTDMGEAREIRGKSRRMGVDLLLIRQKHLGSDKLPEYILRIVNYLIEHNTVFFTGMEVKDFIVVDGVIRGVITDRGNIYSD